MSLSSLIKLHDLHKSYHLGKQTLPVLKGINLKVDAGEIVSIMGSSGSGKSTLMNILGLLDRHDQGEFYLNEKLIGNYSDNQLSELRNQNIGFIFQQFFLLPRLTALQNVSLPLIYRGITGKTAKEKCLEQLELVGMADYISHKPHELSGGQQQRVAIARALVAEPQLILADEPTGALDSKIGQEVMDLFLSLNQQQNKTVLVITHDSSIAKQCQRIIHLKDGLIIEDLR